ncbi:hypothetical protein JCM5350_004627 [Sporobolomyces pararoseus]
MSTIRLRRLRPPSSHLLKSKHSSHSSPAPPARSALLSRLYSFLPHVISHPCTSLSSFFASFGTYLSTHQVPSLLLTALIICSLLSPSLLLYFAPPSTSHSAALSNSPLTSRGRGELVWELEGLKRQGLISTEEPVCWDRVKKYYELTGRELGGRRLRVEQLLVNVNLLRKGGKAQSEQAKAGTIGKDVIHKSWKLEKELEKRLIQGMIEGNDCLRDQQNGNCAVLSPARWWQDEQTLLNDGDVHETLSRPPPPNGGHRLGEDPELESPDSLPLTLSETFVGVGFDRSGSVKTAQHLILTFFLQDVPSRSTLPPTSTTSTISSGRQPVPVHTSSSNSTVLEDLEREQAKLNWRKAVREVIQGINHSELEAEKEQDRMILGISNESKNTLTRHVLLKYLPHLVVDAHPRRLENIIYAFGYLLVIVYVARYIRRLRAHSKMGLIITGIAELSSSGIMSVSICWLMGWNLGLVPWNLMAFLVLTSGLDNMILVLRAISQTDLNLTVPERMAVGLKQVGVEMTVLLMVEELIAAWLLWFVEITVMRQWIRFGAVVLAVDYFLELTFFSTVLSIDIQRLELADLLAHNASASQSSNDPVSSQTSTSSKSQIMSKSSSTQKSFEGFIKGSWKVLKDRPAKTSTVAFLWVINVLLWAFYGSEHYLPATCSQTALSSDRPFLAPSLDPSLSRALRLGQTDPSAASHLSVPLGSGQAFWNLVNPNNASSVQIYLEPTISIQLFETPTSHLDNSYSSSFDDDELHRSPAPESIQLGRTGGVTDLLNRDDGEVGVWTKVMIVVLPILAVMGLLRLLLVYLLKDAELLQARWGSEERVSGREKDEDGSVSADDQAEVEVVNGIEPARRQHRGDVELMATGGEVIVSWAGLEEEIQVRRRIVSSPISASGRPSFDRSNSEPDPALFATRLHIPLAAEPVSILALSVDSEGKFCSAVTNRGRVFVWALERGGTLVDFGTSPSEGVAIATPGPNTSKEGKRGETPAPPLTMNGTNGGSRFKSTNEPCFYSLHGQGKIVRWNCGSCEVETILERDQEEEVEIVRRQLIVPTNSFDGTTTPLLVQTLEDGRLKLVRLDVEESRRIAFDLPNSNEAGRGGSIVALATFPVVSPVLGSVVDQSIVAVSHPSSGLTFYSVSPSLPPTPLVTLPPLDSSIRQLRLTRAPADNVCSSCLETVQDGFLASVSSRTQLRVYRIFTPPISSSIETCACNSSLEALGVSRSRASSFGILGASPAMSRVLSNGANSSRRFSPRKKPTTPTRPVAFNSNPSSTMSTSTSADPFLVASQSNAPSNLNDPSNAVTPAQARKASFSSNAQLSPAPPPPKRTTSATSLEDTSPSPTVKSSPESPPEEAASIQLRGIEVATIAIDDRSGWEVAGDRIVGLRRKKGEEGRGWEVWSLSLGRQGGKIEEGYREGTTSLSRLLADLDSTEEDQQQTRPHTSFLVPPARNSTLRRRHSPQPYSSLRSDRTPDSSPSLPFSRVGPLTQSFSSTSVSIALGNQIVTLSPSSPILKDTIDSNSNSRGLGLPPTTRF